MGCATGPTLALAPQAAQAPCPAFGVFLPNTPLVHQQLGLSIPLAPGVLYTALLAVGDEFCAMTRARSLGDVLRGLQFTAVLQHTFIL